MVEIATTLFLAILGIMGTLQPPAESAGIPVFVTTRDQRLLLGLIQDRIAFRGEFVEGEIACDEIAGWKRLGGDRIRLTLRNGSLLQGSVGNQTIAFRSGDAETTLGTSAIVLLERQTAAEIEPTSEPCLWIEMKNGDAVRAEVPSEPLSLVTSAGVLSRPWEEIAELQLERGRQIALTTKTGEILRGTCDLDHLGIRISDVALPLLKWTNQVKSITFGTGKANWPVVEFALESDSDWVALRFPKCEWEYVKSEIESGGALIDFRVDTDGKGLLAQIQKRPVKARLWIRFNDAVPDTTDLVIEKGALGNAHLSVVYGPRQNVKQSFDSVGGSVGKNARSYEFHLRPKPAPASPTKTK